MAVRDERPGTRHRLGAGLRAPTPLRRVRFQSLEETSMPDESPAAATPEEERQGRTARLFATRGRKVFAIVSGAFLATIGGTLAAWTLAFGRSSTEKAL